MIKLIIILSLALLLPAQAKTEKPVPKLSGAHTQFGQWVIGGGWHFASEKEKDGAFNLGFKNFIINTTFEDMSARWIGLGANIDHKGRASLSVSPFATSHYKITVGPELNFATDGNHRIGISLGWAL